MRLRKAIKKGVVSSIAYVAPLLRNPGDFVVVRRDVDRNFVMLCPDGCGERIVLNLDARSGKAWRLYEKRARTTLYPSVWRDTGCRSHFILWNDVLLGLDDSYVSSSEIGSRLIQDVFLALACDRYLHFADVAELLGETPWDVLEACRQLVAENRVIGRAAQRLGTFKRTQLR